MEDRDLKHFTGRDYTRQRVRIRDNFTCQKCRKKWVTGMRRFDTHHLGNLCGKKSRGYDKVESIRGLITYCHKCHLNLHFVKKKMSVSHKNASPGVLIAKRRGIIRALLSEYSQVDVARIMNMKPQTVYASIKKYNLKSG